MSPVLFYVLLAAVLMLFSGFVSASMQFSSLAQQHADAPLISYDIKQDQQGYIWFASELDGLQRFDGYEISRRKVLSDSEPKAGMANVNQLLIDGQRANDVRAADRGVRVFTVGLGTKSGEIVGWGGRSMRVQLDEETLQTIADLTRGMPGRPFKDQVDNPNFDSSNITFAYDQLFRDSRFSGSEPSAASASRASARNAD